MPAFVIGEICRNCVIYSGKMRFTIDRITRLNHMQRWIKLWEIEWFFRLMLAARVSFNKKNILCVLDISNCIWFLSDLTMVRHNSLWQPMTMIKSRPEVSKLFPTNKKRSLSLSYLSGYAVVVTFNGGTSNSLCPKTLVRNGKVHPIIHQDICAFSLPLSLAPSLSHTHTVVGGWWQ